MMEFCRQMHQLCGRGSRSFLPFHVQSIYNDNNNTPALPMATRLASKEAPGACSHVDAPQQQCLGGKEAACLCVFVCVVCVCVCMCCLGGGSDVGKLLWLVERCWSNVILIEWITGVVSLMQSAV